MPFPSNNKLLKKLFAFCVFGFFFLSITTFCFAADVNLEYPLMPGQEPQTPGQFIKTFFTYGLGMVGIVALFAIIIGGAHYILSGGSESKKTEGKRWIWGAIGGLILLLFSYWILRTIHPQFVSLQEPNLTQNISTGGGGEGLEVPLISGQTGSMPTPGQYIKTFFIFGLGLIGIIALFAIVYGGFVYFLSAGNPAMKTHGKKWIWAAISGLALLLLSYLVLITIHPQFVSLQEPNLQQSIPAGGGGGQEIIEMPLGGESGAMPTPGQYIKTFFTYGLGLVGIAALFAIAFGGITYLLSAGSETIKTNARQWIWGAVSGIILLLLSFLILNTIHPQLVSLKEPDLNQQVQQSNGQTGLIEIPLISGETPKTPSDYTRIAFLFGLGIVGITALFGLTFGGLNYILSAGSIVSKDEGKKWIIGAVSGIALLLCSYLILVTINPQLISLATPTLETIEIPPHLGLGYNLTNEQIASLPVFANTDINQAIKDASARYGVPEDMIRAVLGRESAGDINAISPKGAQGLMQLMPGTAAQMGVTNPYDPVQNIYGGVKYLSMQYQRFGNWTDTLAAYNAGPQRVVDYGGGANVPFSETQQYISKIRSTVPQYF